MELKITEEHGWSKTLKLEKAIIRIGDSSANDIQLNSPNIAPIHLQILCSPASSSCRVINLAGGVVLNGKKERNQTIAAGIFNIYDGDEIVIGEYTIAFHLPLGFNFLRKSAVIDASVSVPDAVLLPNAPLNCRLSLINAGTRDACQFQIIATGLPEDCIHIDPVPLMYPGAQEEVRLQFFHHITYPEAGYQEITVRIFAPDDYPGEELVLALGIYVAPVLKQSLEILDDLTAAMENGKQTVTPSPVVGEEGLAPQRSPMSAEQFVSIGDMQATTNQAPSPLQLSIDATEGDTYLTETPLEDTSPVTNARIPLTRDMHAENLNAVTYQQETASLPITPIAEVALAADGHSVTAEQPLNRPKNAPQNTLSKMKVVRSQPNEFWEDK
jgi:hypothetical protein